MNLIDKKNIELLILGGKKIFVGTYAFNSLDPNIIS